MNSKKRAMLKKLSHSLKPILQLGKNGITQEFINELDIVLEKYELTKISILSNCDDDKNYIIDEICKKARCDFVSYIGSKFVVYRKSFTLDSDKRIKL